MSTPFRRFRLQLFAIVGLIALTLPEVSALASDKPDVYVFLPTSIPPRKLQGYLNKAAPSLNFTVFGRQKDFVKTIKTAPPAAILAHRPVIEGIREQNEPVLQGTLEGKEAQQYVLVSVDQAVDQSNFGQLNVGAVDLLGRRQMSKFVAKLLGVPKVKVKRVTKIDDLLPLLQFNMADAVMLPPDAVENFRKKSALNLQVTPIDAGMVGLPSVSVLSTGERQVVIDALEQVNSQVMTRMGVDVWKKL